MTKGQEIIEELGFKLPELDCEEGALEIFFVDKCGIIHGRFGCEAIRWDKQGLCFTHPNKFNLVEVKWYDIPSNFPCLVKDLEENYMVATHSGNKFIYTEGYVFDKTKAIPATLEEVTKLIIKEGK